METIKIHTDVDLKYFNEKVPIAENVSTDDDKSRYAFKVNHGGKKYLIKGFKAYLNQLDPKNEAMEESFNDCLGQFTSSYQRYCFAKFASSAASRFATPLFVDCKAEKHLETTACICVYTEAIFEDFGVPLTELRPIPIELAYKLMKQSADTLMLLKNNKVEPLDIKPDKMVYDKDKDLLKIVDLGSSLSSLIKKGIESPESEDMVFAPPEILRKEKSSADPAEIYYWAMTFYSLIASEHLEELEPQCQKFKQEAEGYKGLIKNIEDSINSLKAENNTAIAAKNVVKSVIIKALEYDPSKRATLSQVISEMENIGKAAPTEEEKSSGAQNGTPSAIPVSVQPSEKIQDPFANLPPNTCRGCLKPIKSKVELNCDHTVCKNCLIVFAFSAFVKKDPYQLSCFCPTCNEVSELKSFVLDCGCEWTKIGESVDYVEEADKIDCGKCEEDHPISYTDSCLINDFMSFVLVSLMLSDFSDEQKALLPLRSYQAALKNEDLENIAWIIKNTKAIKELDLSGKELEDSGGKVIGKALEDNDSITHLNLSNTSLREESSQVIVTALEDNSTLRYLNLNNNRIGTEATKTLARILKMNMTLRHLELKNTLLLSNGLEAIGELLKFNKTIETLELQGSCQGNSIEALAEALKTNAGLKYLGLEANNLSLESLRALCGALKVNKTILGLNLRANNIEVEGATLLSDMLRVNKKLQNLNVSRNALRNKGAVAIFQALKVNIGLKVLNLQSCYIGGMPKNINTERHRYREEEYMRKIHEQHHQEKERASKRPTEDTTIEAIKALGEALKFNKHIEELNLRENDISYDGCKAIGVALKTNKVLKNLKLASTRLDDECVEFLTTALKTNTKMDTLDLSYNRIDYHGGKFVAELLNVNKNLVNLDLEDTRIGPLAGKEIAMAFKNGTKLVSLILSCAYLGVEAGAGICAILITNTTLKRLELANNDLGAICAKVISDGLKKNKTLEILDLEMNCLFDDGAAFIIEGLKANKTLKEIILINNGFSTDAKDSFEPLMENKERRIVLN